MWSYDLPNASWLARHCHLDVILTWQIAGLGTIQVWMNVASTSNRKCNTHKTPYSTTLHSTTLHSTLPSFSSEIRTESLGPMTPSGPSTVILGEIEDWLIGHRLWGANVKWHGLRIAAWILHTLELSNSVRSYLVNTHRQTVYSPTCMY